MFMFTAFKIASIHGSCTPTSIHLPFWRSALRCCSRMLAIHSPHKHMNRVSVCHSFLHEHSSSLLCSFFPRECARWLHVNRNQEDLHSVLLQPVNGVFLSHETSTSHRHQPASSIFLSQQISTNHQPEPVESAPSDVLCFVKHKQRNSHHPMKLILFSVGLVNTRLGAQYN